MTAEIVGSTAQRRSRSKPETRITLWFPDKIPPRETINSDSFGNNPLWQRQLRKALVGLAICLTLPPKTEIFGSHNCRYCDKPPFRKCLMRKYSPKRAIIPALKKRPRNGPCFIRKQWSDRIFSLTWNHFPSPCEFLRDPFKPFMSAWMVLISNRLKNVAKEISMWKTMIWQSLQEMP